MSPEEAPAGPAGPGRADGRSAYARLVLELLPEESRIGLTLGFVRTFAVPAVAAVLHRTGRMTSTPKDRAKATGVAMFALIDHGPGSAEGRRIVAGLRRVHERPGITVELMQYVLACFTVCPLRFLDEHGPRAVTGPERDSAYTFHLELSDALGLPRPEGADLAGVERWMRGFEGRRFAPSEEGGALWRATGGLLAARLPAPLSRLAPALAAALLDDPLRAALGQARPPAPLRLLVTGALRLARARRRRTVRTAPDRP